MKRKAENYISYLRNDPRSAFVKQYQKEVNLTRIGLYVAGALIVLIDHFTANPDPSGMGQGLMLIYSVMAGVLLTVVELVLRTNHFMTFFHVFALPTVWLAVRGLLIGVP